MTGRPKMVMLFSATCMPRHHGRKNVGSNTFTVATLSAACSAAAPSRLGRGSRCKPGHGGYPRSVLAVAPSQGVSLLDLGDVAALSAVCRAAAPSQVDRVHAVDKVVALSAVSPAAAPSQDQLGPVGLGLVHGCPWPARPRPHRSTVIMEDATQLMNCPRPFRPRPHRRPKAIAAAAVNCCSVRGLPRHGPFAGSRRCRAVSTSRSCPRSA